MSSSLSPQQDFFIYVPSRQDAERPAHIPAHALPNLYTNWVQIPLAETLVIYARLCDEQETTDDVDLCQARAC